MKVPLSWVSELVAVDLDLDLAVAELATRLTMAGLEVEAVRHVGADWRGVTISRVVDLERHPRASALSVARLDLGGREATVVTAAPNLHVGAVVPHVAAGGRLPAGEVGSRTFQGIMSEGMVCSGDELDISPDKDGIYLLEEDAPVGEALAAYLGEVVLDIYVTANRPDCMSMVGIAREIHALTGAPYRALMGQIADYPPPGGRVPAGSLLSVQIEDVRGCPRFTAGLVQGLAIRPSPHRVQRRLHFAGVRPISNVVDVTNYVMLEVGQPLHAFDRQRLSGPRIVVRRAADGERLVTLDGEERTLRPDMMVVADEAAARSLAGIMGGADSEITPDTRDVVIEGANWDRATTRITSAALGLTTEAGRRFGRGVDPELTVRAVSRAVAMTLDLSGGTSAAGLVDEYPGRVAPPVIRVRPAQIEALLGTAYPTEVMVSSLSALDFGVQQGAGGELVVSVPSHRRFDVEHRADLAEEVARLVGYETIPTTTLGGRLPEPRRDGDGGFGVELLARRALAAAGLQEVITYSLVDPGLAASLAATPEAVAEAAIRVANPPSAEHSVLRPGLLGSLLHTVRTSLRHRPRLLIFELARTWHGELAPLPREERHVGIALTGRRSPEGWATGDAELDFFDLKGIVETLAAALAAPLVYEAGEHPSLHPGRTARVCAASGELVGFLGQVHPVVAEQLGLERRAVLAAELDFELLLRVRSGVAAVATPSRFPPAQRDIAVVVAEATRNADVETAIRRAAAPLLHELRVFDVYRGGAVAEGRKSLAYALSYQAADRTLADDEVAAVHGRVEQALTATFGAEVRGRDTAPI